MAIDFSCCKTQRLLFSLASFKRAHATLNVVLTPVTPIPCINGIFNRFVLYVSSIGMTSKFSAQRSKHHGKVQEIYCKGPSSWPPSLTSFRIAPYLAMPKRIALWPCDCRSGPYVGPVFGSARLCRRHRLLETRLSAGG